MALKAYFSQTKKDYPLDLMSFFKSSANGFSSNPEMVGSKLF